MMAPNFNQLFEETALKLFRDYQSSCNMISFFQSKLPQKYSIQNGILVNRQKEITTSNYIFFDRLNCPCLEIASPEKLSLYPVNYTYGSLSILSEINQSSLEQTLQQNRLFKEVYKNQNVGNLSDVRPLNIWFATDLASFLSLNDLEDRLLAEMTPPDLVAVQNKGVLVTLNKQTIQNIFALNQREGIQSFDKTITADLINITQKRQENKYFKMGATAAYKNFFYYYVLLVDLLKNQPLIDDELSAELVAIW